MHEAWELSLKWQVFTKYDILLLALSEKYYKMKSDVGKYP